MKKNKVEEIVLNKCKVFIEGKSFSPMLSFANSPEGECLPQFFKKFDVSVVFTDEDKSSTNEKVDFSINLISNIFLDEKGNFCFEPFAYNADLSEVSEQETEFLKSYVLNEIFPYLKNKCLLSLTHCITFLPEFKFFLDGGLVSGEGYKDFSYSYFFDDETSGLLNIEFTVGNYVFSFTYNIKNNEITYFTTHFYSDDDSIVFVYLQSLKIPSAKELFPKSFKLKLLFMDK